MYVIINHERENMYTQRSLLALSSLHMGFKASLCHVFSLESCCSFFSSDEDYHRVAKLWLRMCVAVRRRSGSRRRSVSGCWSSTGSGSRPRRAWRPSASSRQSDSRKSIMMMDDDITVPVDWYQVDGRSKVVVMVAS
jgi:hypothetical protein